MTYYVTTPEDMTLLTEAINLLGGLTEPVRGTVVGGPDSLPTEFAGPGTPGWTDTLFRGCWLSADQTMAGVEVTPEMVQFGGQSIMVGDVLVTVPTEAECVADLPPELLEENGAVWWDGGPLPVVTPQDGGSCLR